MKKAILNLLMFIPFLFTSGFAPIDTGCINDFRLKNVDGRYVSLKDYPDAKGFIIVFTCNHCPFAKLYPPRLNDINARYKKLGVPLIAISSTDTIIYDADSYPKMVSKAQAGKYNFPYLYDNMQTVARNFNAQKTPHAYVLWKEGGKWIVKYNGGIDDNGAKPELVKNHYVTDAVDALLAGNDVAIKETKSIGCKISFR
jgi:peroxiredoxin